MLRFTFKVSVVAFAMMLTACDNNKLPKANPSGSDPIASLETPTPSRNYQDVEDGTYYYISAVSEEDQKKGIALGKVSGFRYLGVNDKAKIVILSVSDNGTALYKSYCSDPCTIIKSDNNERVPYDPNSIIGAAFQDAMNGYLEIHKSAVKKSSDTEVLK